MQLQTTSPESKFPNEYIGVILFKSINIWKSYFKNTKGSWFFGTRCTGSSATGGWCNWFYSNFA